MSTPLESNGKQSGVSKNQERNNPKKGVQSNAIRVAVVGNPNSGKSTLINAIAGTRLHVGNWPGVTVEKKEATLEHKGMEIQLVDLPGTYSLSPYTQEEVIARDYLIHEKPDVIIDLVDATNLERNLYLTVQLMELETPMVMALNIFDEAEAKGIRIDTKAMEEMLGMHVVQTVATKARGLDLLLEKVIETAGSHRNGPKRLSYGPDIELPALQLWKQMGKTRPAPAGKFPQRWLALKLLEGDEYIYRELNLPVDEFPGQEMMSHLKKAHDSDIEAMMADARYALASGLTREVSKLPELGKADLTEKIDRVVLNRFLGIPVFLASMWLVFKLTFDVSTPFVDWIDKFTAGPVKRWMEAILEAISAPDWTISLVNDGVIAGAGFVLVFVPVIFAMMFFITFLEGSGYMARAAFVMDRAMHSMGLHGKSFIPMLLAFGCNVPAIYATRTLENPKDKALTALLIPLMSCGARLPVYVLFVGAFFASHAGTVLWSMYVIGMVMAVLVGIIFKKTLFKGESPMFIMELPPYRMPTFKNLMIHTWEKGKHFLVKAGTYIFAVSVLVWFLMNLPWGVENARDSYLGRAGAAITPVLKPIGFENWEASSALIAGVIAKEIVVGTMGIIYTAEIKEEDSEAQPTFIEDLKEVGTSLVSAVGEAFGNVFSTFGIASLQTDEEEQEGLRGIIQTSFTPLTAYAFMAFVLLYMPCVVALIAMRHEFMTWKWSGIAFAYQLTLAWMVAFVIYQGGKLLGLE